MSRAILLRLKWKGHTATGAARLLSFLRKQFMHVHDASCISCQIPTGFQLHQVPFFGCFLVSPISTSASMPTPSSALSSCQVFEHLDNVAKHPPISTRFSITFESSSLLGARVRAAGIRILHDVRPEIPKHFFSKHHDSGKSPLVVTLCFKSIVHHEQDQHLKPHTAHLQFRFIVDSCQAARPTCNPSHKYLAVSCL